MASLGKTSIQGSSGKQYPFRVYPLEHDSGKSAESTLLRTAVKETTASPAEGRPRGPDQRTFRGRSEKHRKAEEFNRRDGELRMLPTGRLRGISAGGRADFAASLHPVCNTGSA